MTFSRYDFHIPTLAISQYYLHLTHMYAYYDCPILQVLTILLLKSKKINSMENFGNFDNHSKLEMKKKKPD